MSPEQHIVRVGNVPRITDVAALGTRLARFGPFQRSRLTRTNGDFYAHYYTASSARRAIAGLDGSSFAGVPLEAEAGRGTGAARPLGRDDSCDLANKFLGYQGWSHRVASVAAAGASGSYRATVVVAFAKFPRSEAVGVAERSGDAGGAGGKKRAVDSALVAALSRVALLVPTGRDEAVAVRVENPPDDPS